MAPTPTDLEIRELMIGMATMSQQLTAFSATLTQNQAQTAKLQEELVKSQRELGSRIEKLEKWQAKMIGAFGLVLIVLQLL